jgi:crotonobetainyl-CoA:carnitine CoA-transferase CaiB-like acyl-CoA transferase
MTNNKSSIRMPSPLLGQHNNEVLRELGYTEADMERLKNGGAFTPAGEL